MLPNPSCHRLSPGFLLKFPKYSPHICSVCSSHTSRTTALQLKSEHVFLLLKMLQWLLIMIRVKSRVLVACEAPYGLARVSVTSSVFSLSSPFSSHSGLCFSSLNAPYSLCSWGLCTCCFPYEKLLSPLCLIFHICARLSFLYGSPQLGRGPE